MASKSIKGIEKILSPSTQVQLSISADFQKKSTIGLKPRRPTSTSRSRSPPKQRDSSAGTLAEPSVCTNPLNLASVCSSKFFWWHHLYKYVCLEYACLDL